MHLDYTLFENYMDVKSKTLIYLLKFYSWEEPFV